MGNDLQPVFTDREFTVDHPPTRREAPTGWPIEVDGIPRDQMASYVVEQRTLAAINAKGRIVKPKDVSLSEHIARIMCGKHAQPSAYRAIRQLAMKGMIEVERSSDGTSPYRAVTSVGLADQWALDEWAKAHPKRKRKPVVPQPVETDSFGLPANEWFAPDDPASEQDAFQTCRVCGGQFYGKANVLAEHMRLDHPFQPNFQPAEADKLDAIADRLLHRAAESIAMYDEKCRELTQLQDRFTRLAQKLTEAQMASHTNSDGRYSRLQQNHDALLEAYTKLQSDYDKLKASTARTSSAQRTYNIIESMDDRSREALLSLIEET